MTTFFATLLPDIASLTGVAGDRVSFAGATVGSVISLNIFTPQTNWALGDLYGGAISLFTLSNFGDFFVGDGRSLTVTGGSGPQSIWLLLNPGNTGTAIGGAGDDTFISSAGTETFDGLGNTFEGDTVAFNASTTGVTASLANQAINTGDAAGDTYLNIENLQGSNFNDILHSVADGQAHQLIGDPGIGNGVGGDDTLFGATGAGAGYTNFIPGAGVDVMHLGDGGNQVDYETAGAGLTVSLINMALNTGDAAGDVLVGAAGKNIDMAGSPFGDTVIGDDGENNILGDPYNDALYAPGGNDQVFGLGGDDRLTGGPGADTLDGGTGLNLAIYSLARQAVVADLATPANGTGEAAGDVYINIQGLLGSAFGDILRGDGNANRLFGIAGNDSLFGGGGDDLLVGGAGADLLDGGAGYDTAIYSESLVGLTIDMVTPANGTGEAAGDSFVFGTVDGIAATAFNDVITGDDGNTFFNAGAGIDTITGGGGNDGIWGATGADLLSGGAGADSFSYLAANESAGASIDTITDFNAGEDGLDLVALAPVNVVLSRTVTGGTILTADVSGTAFQINLLTNISGVDIRGLSGGITVLGSSVADVMFGSVSSDVMIGGAGQDTLTGQGGADVFRYLAAADSTAAAPDLITDFLTGVTRLDVSALGASSAVITHPTGRFQITITTPGGTIVVDSTRQISPGDILGLNGPVTIIGDDSGETYHGTQFNDTIRGAGGPDALLGLGGADLFLYGSAAESTSVALDSLQDFETGIDRIDISAIGLLGAAPQQLSLQHAGDATFLFATTSGGDFSLAAAGSLNGDDLIGLTRGVYMVGDAPAEVLRGSSSTDLIDGNGGADTITGGDGADIIRYFLPIDSTAEAPDIILDFQGGVDKFDLGSLSPSAVSIARLNGGTTITVIGGAGTAVFTTLSAVNADDFLTFFGTAQVTGDNFFQGSAFNDSLVGSSADETFNGGEGNDTLQGEFGNDQYIVNSVGDLVVEAANAGTDTAYVTFSGHTLAANLEVGRLFGVNALSLSGGAGDNTLVGNDFGLASSMAGGAGDDVFYSSASADLLDGGDGQDIFYTGGGADTVLGGTGNDQAVIYDSGVVFTEAADPGIDTAWIGAARFTLGPNVEIARLFGAGFLVHGSDTAEDLVANTTASVLNGNGGNDVLWGQGGADLLDGGAGDDIFRTGGGADQCTGGMGHDSYVFTDTGARAIEAASEGYDIVYQGAAGVFAIGENIEEARLFGAGDYLGGNALANLLVANNAGIASSVDGGGGDDIIYGSTGNDVIIGGAGNDELRALGGADTFVFSGAWGQDQVVDFSRAEGDKLFIIGASFAQLGIVSGGNTEITFAGNSIYLFGVSGMQASDFIFG